MSRHTTYHELVDTFEQRSCPVCMLAIRRARRTMESLLWENINDIDVRLRLRRSYGFCGEHAAQLVAVHDPLGGAILYRDIVKTVGEKLKETAGQARNPSRLRKALEPLARGLHRVRYRDWGKEKETSCLACEAQDAAADLYLLEVLEHIGEADFREQFARSARLCLPHFVRALELGKDGNATALLVEAEIAGLASLQGELEEAIRKSDYRHQYEPKGDEFTAWIRAVGRVIGRPVEE